MSNTAVLMALFRLNLPKRPNHYHHHPEVDFFLRQEAEQKQSPPPVESPKNDKPKPPQSGGGFTDRCDPHTTQKKPPTSNAVPEDRAPKAKPKETEVA